LKLSRPRNRLTADHRFPEPSRPTFHRAGFTPLIGSLILKQMECAQVQAGCRLHDKPSGSPPEPESDAMISLEDWDDSRGGRLMAKKPKSDSPKRDVIIPDGQWDLPVGFTSSGAMVTLREATHGPDDKKPATPTLALSQLSSCQLAELTAKRIEMQPSFQIGGIGSGIVNKERAIAEVKAQTALGHNLMEIEMRVIQDVLSLANHKMTPTGELHR
jgi:hypothetical protein